MRFLSTIISSSLILGVTLTYAKPAWNFDEAIISVTGKSAAENGYALKDKLSDNTPLAKPLILGAADTLKIIITITEDETARRPHQAFLLIREQETGLDATFPFSVKENGRGKVEVMQKNLPVQFIVSPQHLRAEIFLASFGPSQAFSNHVFNLEIKPVPNTVAPKYEKPLRYGKREEIHHIFRPEAKSGPAVLSIFFVLAVAATLPVLFSSWIQLGANLTHLPMALRKAPVAHTLFFGSILALEGVLFLYYYTWTLFQVLPVAGVIGLVTILSGSHALSEVQGRRLEGQR